MSNSVTEREPQKSGALGRTNAILLGVASAIAILMMLREFSGLVGPIFLALNLMITAYPLHNWLVRKGTPSWLSALITTLMVFATLIAMVVGFVWSVNEMVDLLPTYSDEFRQIFDQAIALGSKYGVDLTALQSLWKFIDPKSVIGAASTFLNSASGVVSMLAVIIAAMVFMAMDTPGIQHRLRLLGNSRSRIAVAMKSFAVGVRKYWLVTTVFGIIVAVLDGIALAILGVPLALVWALFSFLTNYIPNIGFVIGLLPPAFVALFSNSWQTSVLVIVIYSVLNFVVQSIIQPRFAGESVGVTPTISFVSLLLWTSVIGGLGSLLALPMTLLVKALVIDADPNARWVNALIASDPNESDGDD